MTGAFVYILIAVVIVAAVIWASLSDPMRYLRKGDYPDDPGANDDFPAGM